ncbi:MAG: protein kinase family protein, partial [Acutalibacteraceae bacterium]
MERNLKESKIIKLKSTNGETEFSIDEVIGVGGSCVAYKVSYYENEDIPHKGVLKEYCPAFLEENGFSRTDLAINIPPEFQEMFDMGLREFKNTYKIINQYLSNNLSAANYHTVQLGLYEGNNTAYTLTSCDYGSSFDKIVDNSLLSIMKILLAVTKAVEMYHNAGYLHLDIKPKNILILDDVTDLVKLFDFDSLTSLSKLQSKEIYSVPIPEDYYVPELENFDIRNIGIYTDIYEIGAMAYARIFRKEPNIEDISGIDSVRIEENDLFVGVSPQARYEVLCLLKNTLQISRRKRYKTTDELKAQLEKIISCLDSKTPYLVNLPKWQPAQGCVGRQKELNEMKRCLDQDGYVFVKAIGGIGKSEIAKLFAQQYSSEYHTVQFCRFNDSLRTVIASMPFDGIDEKQYKDFNELVNAKNKALHLTDNHTLIIIDNFNVTYDDFLRDFLPADKESFKVIFTTRCKPESDYYNDKIFELPKLSMEECKSVYALHCPFPDDRESIEKIESLIEKVDYNTLIIVLMSVALKKSGISLDDMLAKLEEQGLKDIEQKFFHEYDISNEEVENYNAIYAHLNTIFSVSGLSDIQKEIMKNATLISANGLRVSDFVSGCDKSYINPTSVTDLSQWGWISIDTDTVISMHPIVSDLIADNDDIKKADSYYHLAECLEEYCNPDYMDHISVVMDRLSCAIQLERRYKNESVFKRCMIAAKLGRMYQNVYYPTEAKKNLLKALDIAKNEKGEKGFIDSFKFHKNPKDKLTLGVMNITGKANRMLLPYIYYFLGAFEKDFGTKTAAIEYFGKSIAEGKKLKNSFFNIVLDSMIGIAQCYKDNSNMRQAYKAYVDAFKYARFYHFFYYLTDIASELVEVCVDLNYKSEEEKYKKYAEKYRKFSVDNEQLAGIDEFDASAESGDYAEALKKYEIFLAEQRKMLGESSPIYKDISKGLWVFYAVNRQKEQALKLLNESIAFISSTYGNDSMELADHLAFAAQIMPDLMEFNYAYDFANRAIEICKKNNETKSYVFCRAKMALANVASVSGKTYEAKEYIADVDFSLFSGNDFLEDFVAAEGIVLANLSEYSILEPMCKQMLEKENVSNASKFLAYILLSISREQQGFLDESEQYAEEAKKYIDYIKTISVKRDWIVMYYRAAARIDFRKGRNKEAVSKLNSLVDLFEKDESEYILSTILIERGLYNALLGNDEAAKEDYARCEKILIENHFSDEAFIQLYNNIAVAYQRTRNYSEAMKYLEKIVKINPNVLTPTSYLETIICGNIGWLSFLS